MAAVFRTVKFIVIAGILGMLAWLVMDHTGDEKRILVVHSYAYDTDEAWLSELSQGLNEPLENDQFEKPENLKVRTHFMDLRRKDCDYYQNAAADVRYTIDNWKPGAVIIFDDFAQGLVGFNHLDWRNTDGQAAGNREATMTELLEFLSKSCGWTNGTLDAAFFGLDDPASGPFPAIIYGGVNFGVGDYGYELAENATGITENKNYTAVVEKLIDLRDASPGPVDGIMFLNDKSGIAVLEVKAFGQHQDWGPFTDLVSRQVDSFSDWKQVVKEANENNLMLLIANYGGIWDEQDRKVPQKTLITWTEENARLPVLGLSTRFVDDGGMITMAVSGTEQGRVAMEMALSVIIDGSLSKPVPAKQYTIGLNQERVEARELKLPSIFEAFSREMQRFVDVARPAE